jgi:flagellar hook-length control protein FliK
VDEGVAPTMPATLASESGDVSPESLHGQIVQGIRLQWQGSAGEARITLRPEYLGAITVSLRVEDGAMSAVLHVGEPQVREWVQANQDLLRQGLAEQGLTLEHLVVSDDTDAPSAGRRDARDEPRRPRRRQGDGPPSDTAPAPFEVAA